jgi:hypothetical protein
MKTMSDVMIGYLDIDINGNVYSNSSATTLVNNVSVVTCVHNTTFRDCGREDRRYIEREAVIVLGTVPVHQIRS